MVYFTAPYYGRKWRGTKEPLDERGEWKSWLKAQYSENEDHGIWSHQFSSVQFSRSDVSDSLGPHESQHARPPCPSPTPRVHSNSRPSSRWCHPAISSSVVPFSSCPPKHQFFSAQHSLQFNSCIHTWPLEKPPLWESNVSAFQNAV